MVAFDLKFNSAGDHTPGILYLAFLASNYYWPKNIPLPIRGSPDTTGIVSGQLYDSLTNYKFTSEMREHFPMTSLLTSQSVSHGFNGGGPEGPCQRYIVDYLEYGVIRWTDGTVCGDPYPYFREAIGNFRQ